MLKESDSEYALYSENLDGSGREKVRAIPLPENTAPQSFYVYRGTLYTVGVANRVEAGTPQTQMRLIAKSGRILIDSSRFCPSTNCDDVL